MLHLGMYEFKNSNIGRIEPEESFNNAYVRELYESEHVRTATKRLRVIFDSKYANAYLHNVMETQCQQLTIAQHNEF